ncbi:MAG: 5-(carboxyamino)imidazole ribonucleotide synthase [Alphaproteobacteria bacterium]|nr:5-(carboxyamino)imidazole ribonucleotide synthase [Alphaproteobacteria bacterium]
MSAPTPLPKGAVIGILGGGQLGRMLAQAADRLGLKSHIYCPATQDENSRQLAPAAQVANFATQAAYDDKAHLTEFAKSVHVVTYEFENVPLDTIHFLQAHVPVRPNAKALQTAQDRLTEKEFMRRLNIATADFVDITSWQTLEAACAQFNNKLILKTRHFGYDGKGQWHIDIKGDKAIKGSKAIKGEKADKTNQHTLQNAFTALDGRAAIAESFVPFEREISVLGARAFDGTIAVFDSVENRHEKAILRQTFAPAHINNSMAEAAQEIATKLLTALDYIGILAVELFVCGDKLLVNEIAPRVHNSGHWTQDACHTSQFEQHIRAIAGWPLGDPTRHHDAIMRNLLGDEINHTQAIRDEPNAKIHIYGKHTVRPQRKMGHVNWLYPLGQRPHD